MTTLAEFARWIWSEEPFLIAFWLAVMVVWLYLAVKQFLARRSNDRD